jgi:hypothetical protein
MNWSRLSLLVAVSAVLVVGPILTGACGGSQQPATSPPPAVEPIPTLSPTSPVPTTPAPAPAPAPHP